MTKQFKKLRKKFSEYIYPEGKTELFSLSEKVKAFRKSKKAVFISPVVNLEGIGDVDSLFVSGKEVSLNDVVIQYVTAQAKNITMTGTSYFTELDLGEFKSRKRRAKKRVRNQFK